MTDADQATLFDGTDAVDIDVADDPAEARTIVTGMTVSASEKVSTGDYENYEPFQQVRVAFDPAIDVATPDGRAEVRQRAIQAHHDVQKDIQRAIDGRLSISEHEDWPPGVDEDDLVADGGKDD